MLERIVYGEVPAKHHIASRGPDGALRHEECITREGFDGPYTIAYHLDRPHTHRPVESAHGWPAPEAVVPAALRKRHFLTQSMAPRRGPAVDARTPLLFNDDLVLSAAFPDADDPVYVSNGDGDDLIFVTRAAAWCAPSSATCPSAPTTTCASRGASRIASSSRRAWRSTGS